MEDLWKQLKDYPNYCVSQNGFVRRIDIPNETIIKGTKCIRRYKTKILKPNFNKTNGYLSVYIKSKDGKYRYCYIHRLVAQAFIPNPKNKREVNHLDGNKLNNCVDNLEWATRKENIRHAFDNELIKTENQSISHNAYKIPVIRLLDGEIVDRFLSIKEASKKLGIYANTIKYACIYSKTHIYKGYEYRLAKDI
jgi:hypothetical protein